MRRQHCIHALIIIINSRNVWTRFSFARHLICVYVITNKQTQAKEKNVHVVADRFLCACILYSVNHLLVVSREFDFLLVVLLWEVKKTIQFFFRLFSIVLLLMANNAMLTIRLMKTEYGKPMSRGLVRHINSCYHSVTTTTKPISD